MEKSTPILSANHQEVDRLLQKLGFHTLTAMQQNVFDAAFQGSDVWLTAPTGSGKTLAYLLPLLLNMQKNQRRLLILVPTRELAIQTTQVIRNLALGYSVSLCYGGNDRRKEISSLASDSRIVVGTPGRLCDHLRNEKLRGPFETIVLDEYDKSLEIGFVEELQDLLNAFAEKKQIILTSATKALKLSLLEGRNQWRIFDFSDLEKSGKVMTWLVTSAQKDKLEALAQLLNDLSGQKVIVFVNYREAAERTGKYLLSQRFSAGIFHGGLDQKEREWMLARFRNGSITILVSTDLSARGLDIPLARNVIHYQMPHKKEDMVHRNGRTGRMGTDGDIFFLRFEGEDLPEFVNPIPDEYFTGKNQIVEYQPLWQTWIFNRGKKEKLNKGDIVGFLIGQFGLSPQDIGPIDLGEHQAMVAVGEAASEKMVEGHHKIKKLNVKIFHKD